MDDSIHSTLKPHHNLDSARVSTTASPIDVQSISEPNEAACDSVISSTDTDFPISSRSIPQTLKYEDGLEVYQFDGLETHYYDMNGMKKVDHDDKQAQDSNEKEVRVANEKELIEDAVPAEVRPAKQPRIFGVRRPFALIGFLLLVVALVAVGLGAGLGTRSRRSRSAFTPDDPDYSIGGALSPAYYSKIGAWNGSGIAFTILPSTSTSQIYFQYWNGDIRFMTLNQSGGWIGGDQSSTIATDAKHSTPISAVVYELNSTAHYHLFYIDNNNHVKQKSTTNVNATWSDGLINTLNLTVLEADLVGLQACWNGHGCAAGALKLPPGTSVNDDGDSCNYGMNLWFATDFDKFENYAWFEGLESWAEQGSFAGMDGRAGVGCYSWGPDSVDYAMMVDADNNLDLWWRDSDSSITSTAEHPVNSWTNTTALTITNVHPSTSLGYDTYLYAQMADYTIKAFNNSFEAQNSTWGGAVLTIGDTTGPIQAVPGTHLTAATVMDNSGVETIYIFLQVEGDDITAFRYDLEGGQLMTEQLPIPVS